MKTSAFHLGLALLVLQIAGACGDDERNGTNEIVEAGVDSSSGAGGRGAGGASKGGGGSGGRATTGGAGGRSTGGSAGATGTGGVADAGTGGTGEAGPDASDASPDDGSTGEAGTDAGDGGPAGSLSCELACETSADCIDPQICDPESKRCIDCVTHDDCTPIVSGWIAFSCTTDSECNTVFDEVCVKAGLGTAGRCVAQVGSGCLFPGEEPISVPRFGTDTVEMVEVCGKKSGRCEDRRCFTGCTDDPAYCTSGSTQGYGETCDTVSGRCTCEDDQECEFGPGRCNPVTHRCDECATSADCNGAGPGQDACVDGRCGCSGTEACPPAAPATGTPVCE